MNNSSLELDLVNGVFSKEECLEVLKNLLQKKIEFHELQIFSKTERAHRDVDASKQRLKELRAQYNRLNHYLINFTDDTHFELKSSVLINSLADQYTKSA